MTFRKESWGATVLDPKAWRKQQRFTTVEGRTYCTVCESELAFLGWCGGAATFACRCAVQQEKQQKSEGRLK